MLARIQRGIVGAVLLLAWVAAWQLQNHGFAASLAGFMAVAGATAAILAIEFTVVGWTNRSDSVPLASLRQLLGAWWGETRAAYATFGWRQPFRAHAVPDYLPPASVPAQRGVVLVHGFFCNRGFWTPWLRALRQ
ncbi:MAG: permease, partial [Pseudomonadota bacterium]